LLDAEPTPSGASIDVAELGGRLLALNEPGAPWRLVEHEECGIQVHWDPVDPAWRATFARVKLSAAFGVRLLLDDLRREVRWYEWSRTANVFIGLDGSRPRFNFPAAYTAGDLRATTYRGVAYGVGPGWLPVIEDLRDFAVDVGALQTRMAHVVADAGWARRSTHIWFQTRPSLFRLAQMLVPEPIRLLSRRQFWGIVYPVSFVLAIAALARAGGAMTAGNVVIIMGISAAWWGLWGLLVWAAISTGSRRRRSPRRR
jgi:hypothetical protein